MEWHNRRHDEMGNSGTSADLMGAEFEFFKPLIYINRHLSNGKKRSFPRQRCWNFSRALEFAFGSYEIDTLDFLLETH